jgi:hypothetical protein
LFDSDSSWLFFYFLVIFHAPALLAIGLGAHSVGEGKAVLKGSGEPAWIEHARRRLRFGHWLIAIGLAMDPLTFLCYEVSKSFPPDTPPEKFHLVWALPWSLALGLSLVILGWHLMRYRLVRLFPKIGPGFWAMVLIASATSTVLADIWVVPRVIHMVRTGGWAQDDQTMD